MDKAQLQQWYQKHQERFFDEWKTFLSFPSISADPAHDKDCQDCAQWLVEHLTAIGFESSLLETTGQPVVYASYGNDPGRPTVIYYGHYDVQPVDPLDLWDTKPFEPTLKGTRLYARGAHDNKGQTFYFIKAIETLVQNNALTCNLKIFIEGEEETGSKGIFDAIPQWGDKLKGDVLMVCDTGAVAKGIPTVTMGLRGIVHLSMRLDGINNDLHSGSHGGMVQNPATEMARLVATLHDATGKVAVEGFYDGVGDIDPADRELANAAPFDDAEYKAQIGVEPLGGEDGFTALERKGFRPTVEVNGIHSGYGGPGTKTIIPDHAIAKLSARLVGKQDPDHVLECMVRHLEKHAPKGLHFVIDHKGEGGPALSLSSKAPAIQKARAVLEQISDNAPVFSWEGGSIPVVSSLAEASGAAAVLVGFGLEEDRIHAPNESFDVDQFADGFLYASLFLIHIGQ